MCEGGGGEEAVQGSLSYPHLQRNVETGMLIPLISNYLNVLCVNYKHNSSPIVQFTFPYGFICVGCRGGTGLLAPFPPPPPPPRTQTTKVKFWMLIPLISNYLNVTIYQ